MELTHDWRGFQSLFLSARKPNQGKSSPIYLILNGKAIVSAYSEEDPLSDWIGATEDEIRAALPERTYSIFDKKNVDEWISESLELSHFYDQAQFLKAKAKPKTPDCGHFLLQAVQGWWRRLFPSTYGIYLQIEGAEASSFLIRVQRGTICSFHPPDLSSFSPDRKKQYPAMIKYLSERYLMPIQGIFITSDEWKKWSESLNPWREVFACLRGNRNKLVPLNIGLLSLVASRAYLNV